MRRFTALLVALLAACTDAADPGDPQSFDDEVGDVEPGWIDIVHCEADVTAGVEVRMTMAEPLPSEVVVDAAEQWASDLNYRAGFDSDEDPATGCSEPETPGMDVLVLADHPSTGEGAMTMALEDALQVFVLESFDQDCNFSGTEGTSGSFEVDGATITLRAEGVDVPPTAQLYCAAFLRDPDEHEDYAP